MITNTDLPYYINDIINIRKSKGVTQGELADLVGIRREHLCMIEKGKSKPSIKVLLSICDELGAKFSIST